MATAKASNETKECIKSDEKLYRAYWVTHRARSRSAAAFKEPNQSRLLCSRCYHYPSKPYQLWLEYSKGSKLAIATPIWACKEAPWCVYCKCFFNRGIFSGVCMDLMVILVACWRRITYSQSNKALRLCVMLKVQPQSKANIILFQRWNLLILQIRYARSILTLRNVV